MTITRYKCVVSNVQATAHGAAHPDGQYVLASDYDAKEAELDDLKARLAEAERERDENYARAISLFAFVPDNTLAGDLQKLRDDFKRWRADAARAADSAEVKP